MEESPNSLHIAIVSSPGMGHLIPVLLLANRLAAQQKVKVKVLSVTTLPESTLPNLPVNTNLVEIIHLPPVNIAHLIDPSTKVVTQLCLMVREALPSIRSAITTMDHKPDALIVDLFGTEALPFADEFNVPKYVYIPSTAWFTALTVYCPILDGVIKGEYVDKEEFLIVPGCKSVRPEDVVEPMLDRTDQQYFEYLRQGREIPLCDGILLNSWEELEGTTLRALRESEAFRSIVKCPVYTIGPLRRPVEPSGSSSDLTDWLDRQPDESVLFVSFGSGGVLSAEQTIELALGLEMSRQRFIWVVRPPTGGRVDDAFFTASNDCSDGVLGRDFLPLGFLSRIVDRGMLVPMWAQQAEILDHKSVGGFLSHCGWNSTLESITSGVPMIAWPLYAEQRMNAAMLVEELGVAVPPSVLPTKEVVGREEIEKMARTLMEKEEGKAMRDRVEELKMSATKAIGQNGSSHKSMCEILSNIVIAKKTKQN